jgi:hypothetical protein
LNWYKLCLCIAFNKGDNTITKVIWGHNKAQLYLLVNTSVVVIIRYIMNVY